MDQLAFVGLESLVDFVEALGSAVPTEEHGDELVPTAKTAGLAFAVMAANDPFKHRSGAQMEKFAETIGYSCVRAAVLVERSLFLQEPSPYPTRALPFRPLR